MLFESAREGELKKMDVFYQLLQRTGWIKRVIVGHRGDDY